MFSAGYVTITVGHVTSTVGCVIFTIGYVTFSTCYITFTVGHITPTVGCHIQCWLCYIQCWLCHIHCRLCHIQCRLCHSHCRFATVTVTAMTSHRTHLSILSTSIQYGYAVNIIQSFLCHMVQARAIHVYVIKKSHLTLKLQKNYDITIPLIYVKNHTKNNYSLFCIINHYVKCLKK